MYYIHTDHLQSSSVMTDMAGTYAQKSFYYPFGETKDVPFGDGYMDFKYKYTGKEWDAETGLYYYGARYYDPKLARFISADTIVPEPYYPQSFNRYAYAYNNPIVLRDLAGYCPVPSGGGGGFWASVGRGLSAIGRAIGRGISAIGRGIGNAARGIARGAQAIGRAQG